MDAPSSVDNEMSNNNKEAGENINTDTNIDQGTLEGISEETNANENLKPQTNNYENVPNAQHSAAEKESTEVPNITDVVQEPPMLDHSAPEPAINSSKYDYSGFSFGDIPSNPNGVFQQDIRDQSIHVDAPQINVQDHPRIETSTGDDIASFETKAVLSAPKLDSQFEKNNDEYTYEKTPVMEAGFGLVPVGNFQNYGMQNGANFHPIV